MNFVVIRSPINRFISIYKYLCFFAKSCGIHAKNFTRMVEQFDLMLRTGQEFEGEVQFPGFYVRDHMKPQSW
ncbi:unnamed protein product, partial [Mesorhabditis belari]